MRICMILEGSYPYVRGGVSNWTHDYICALPQHDFVLWTIGAFEKDRGSYKYKLPDNVKEVHELFLDSSLNLRARKNKRFSFSKEESEAIKQMMQRKDPDWDIIFNCYNTTRRNPVEFFMSLQFLENLKEICLNKYHFASFTEIFYTMRSMFLPVIYLISHPVPEADIYHATASGYSGILGALAKWKNRKPFVLTEHGIYTREREQEILRSKWVQPSFKEMWVEMFYMFSRCAYNSADAVTSLFKRASEIQQEIGCPSEKCKVIHNGINYEPFINIKLKEPDGWVDIGAIVRLAPIKDIKTMIYSFAALKSAVYNARLHILGDVDDKEYYDECISLIEQLNVEDILIKGSVDVKEYMKKLDFTVLTSISEGQPLSVIESMFAARPVVCTDVGCCRELIEGFGDDLGSAGICCPPMHQQAISRAMAALCRDEKLRLGFGLAGRQRMLQGFSHKRMMDDYLAVYERVI